MKISVVIPSRNETVGLWATIISAKGDLCASGIDHEIIVVENSEKPPSVAAHFQITEMAKVFFAGPEYRSPQAARHLGFERASGEVIVFADAHVLFPAGFFRAVLETFTKTGADLVHTPNRYLDRTAYGMRVAWDEYLWGSEVVQFPSDGEPFKIAIAGHGAFAVLQKKYKEAGGYWQWLRGFGGEETQLNFKMWFLGNTCWMAVNTFHWHYLPPGGRHTDRMFEDADFVRNFLGISFVFGGIHQLRKAYEAFRVLHWKTESLYMDLALAIPRDPEVISERDRLFKSSEYRNLSDLRAMFGRTGVVN